MLPDFETHPAGPVATMEPSWGAAGRVWHLRVGYEYAELHVFGGPLAWPGYRAATPEAAQAAADEAIAAKGWPRCGPWEHGRLLDLADGSHPEVWRAAVRDEHVPLGPPPEED